MTPTQGEIADGARRWLDILVEQGYTWVRYNVGGLFPKDVEFYVCHRCGAQVSMVVPDDFTDGITAVPRARFKRPIEVHIMFHAEFDRVARLASIADSRTRPLA